MWREGKGGKSPGESILTFSLFPLLGFHPLPVFTIKFLQHGINRLTYSLLDAPLIPVQQSLSIKSIKSLAPLLDRVLIQRAKVVEVSPFISHSVILSLAANPSALLYHRKPPPVSSSPPRPIRLPLPRELSSPSVPVRRGGMESLWPLVLRLEIELCCLGLVELR